MLELMMKAISKMDDELAILTLVDVCLNKICEKNCFEKDADGNILHPCSPDCPAGNIFHCTELADLHDRVVHGWKVRVVEEGKDVF